MGRSAVDAVLTGGGTATGTTGLLFGAISTSSSGDTTLVAADATRKIKVVSYVVVAASAVSVKFKSASNDVTGAEPFAANGGAAVLGTTFAHLFETVANQALVINLSGAVAVGGHFSYFLEA
jgi:hypothetical protein